MKQVEIYTKVWCGYCRMAKALLDAKGVEYEEIDVTRDAAREREMLRRAGRHTVPQIFIDGEPVGGYDDVARLDRQGRLDARLGIACASA